MKQNKPDWSALDRAEKNLAAIRATLDRLAADNQRHKLALDRVAVRVVPSDALPLVLIPRFESGETRIHGGR